MNNDIRAIAFYLPQFHQIPENDKWWGEGFTEWSNTKKTKPFFSGHHYSHIPHDDIGHYNLLDPEIREKQAEMARRHGIEGFCYYHYWFHGKQLLEEPLKQVLESRKPNFPFCICWANETWSRRWDGKDHEILIEQKFSPSDDIKFIRNLIPYFKDDRYIRINGRPLLLVWRSEKLPDPKATVKRWQEEMKREGLPQPYLVRVESHATNIHPKDHGFDAAVDFAPNGSTISIIPKNQRPTDAPAQLSLFDYIGTMHNIFSRIEAPYKRFQGVFTSWDNCARKKRNGSVYLNSSPENFRYLLYRVVKNINNKFRDDEKLIFINAWNEWAEGCHLEPDQKYGYGYLEACKKVLLPDPNEKDIAFGSDDYIEWLEKKTLVARNIEKNISSFHMLYEKAKFPFRSPRRFFNKHVLRKDI